MYVIIIYIYIKCIYIFYRYVQFFGGIIMDFTYEIIKKLGVLSESGKWSKQVNLIEWSDNAPKYDIRTWNTETNAPGKGLALSLDEMKALKEILNSVDLDAE